MATQGAELWGEDEFSWWKRSTKSANPEQDGNAVGICHWALLCIFLLNTQSRIFLWYNNMMNVRCLNVYLSLPILYLHTKPVELIPYKTLHTSSQQLPFCLTLHTFNIFILYMSLLYLRKGLHILKNYKLKIRLFPIKIKLEHKWLKFDSSKK